MKLRIKIISLVLCIIFVGMINCEAAFVSYIGLNESSTINAYNVEFTDNEGNVISTLTPGSVVNASVRLRKSNEIYQKASLVLSLFSGEENIKSTSNYIELSSYGDFTLTNSINIPDVAGLTLYAYLWDGINTAVPLATSALLGSDNINVDTILIDGLPLEGFSNSETEYTVNLDSSYNDYPKITVRTADLSAKTNITELYSFSSAIKQVSVLVTSQSGMNSRRFLITFKQERAEVSNITLNGVEASPETSILSEPNWSSNQPTAAPSNNGTTNYLNSNIPSSYTSIYTDNNYYYINISPELIGGTAINLPASLGGQTNATSGSNTSLVSFNINHTADVYVNTLSETSYPQLVSAGFENIGTKAYRIEAGASNYKYLGCNFFKKTYNVEKGENITVELPYAKSNAMYSVIVCFSDGESRIKNASYTDKNGEITNVEINKYYEPVTKFGAPSKIGDCLFKTDCFSDNSYHTMYNLPESAQGADALKLPLYTGNKNIQSISLTLARTASVYFCWRDTSSSVVIDDMTSLGDMGYTRYSSSIQYGILSETTYYQFPSQGGIFRKDYYLEPGTEQTIVFDDIPVSTQSICYIFVTDINYDYYDPEGTINIGTDSGVCFEADNSLAHINEPFIKTSVLSQSAVAVSSNAVINTSGSPTFDDSKALIYPISVEENGNYYIWMKVYAKDSGSDSFFFGYDSATPMYITPAYKDEWQWILIKTINLTRGRHDLKIYHRERNIAFNKIAVSMNPSYTPDDFSWKSSVYSPGNITPPANTHPRVLMTAEDIPQIKSNLNHEQNKEVYANLIKDAGYNTNGYFSEYESMKGTNADIKTITAAGDCAFLYAVNNDIAAGEKAVRILKNIIASLTVIGSDTTYISRHIGNTLFNCALVYDWCYDLLDEETKQDFIGLFYVMASQLETGWPPTKMSNTTGHALEGEILKDYLAVGIAVYDENTEIYNNIAGRIINKIVPVKNHYSQSMQLFEGTTYGPFREFYTMMSIYMFKAMGYPEVFDSIENQLYGLFYNRKPDGRYVSTGDNSHESIWGYSSGFNSVMFMAGNYYKDPYLKREYYRGSHMGNTRDNDAGMISPLIHLVTNDVSVSADKSFRELPLTAFYNYPSGIMSARTSWDEGVNSNTMHVQMNIQQQYFGGHQHLDSGHFDIYYKGTLAIDSGVYESDPWTDSNGKTVTNLAYGSDHDFNYHKRTVAHNSMLVYNPDEIPVQSNFKNIDGGQNGKFQDGALLEPESLTDGTADVGYVLSYDFGEDIYNPEYSYLKGNLSQAYNSQTVTDYTRTFMFLNFKDETYPGALIVYDNITGAKKDWVSGSAFKKSWLLHSQEEPNINGIRTTITATTLEGNNGRLINDTLLPANAVLEKIGGSGNEFVAGEINYPAVPKTANTESGNWRLEISGKKSGSYYNTQEEFLNVIQVNENLSSIKPLETTLITSVSGYNGIKIKDRIVYLKKAETISTSNLTLAETDGEYMQIVDGLGAGLWNVKNSSGDIVAKVNVYSGHNTLSFKAPAGKYTLSRVSSANSISKDYSIFSRMNNLSDESIDVKINNIYETFHTAKPYISEDNLYLPAEELADKLGKSYNYYQSSNRLAIGGRYMPSGSYEVLNGIMYISPQKAYSYLGKTVSWNSYSKILFIK